MQWNASFNKISIKIRGSMIKLDFFFYVEPSLFPICTNFMRLKFLGTYPTFTSFPHVPMSYCN